MSSQGLLTSGFPIVPTPKLKKLPRTFPLPILKTSLSIYMIRTISSSSLKNFQIVATSIKRDSKILQLSSYELTHASHR